MNNENFIEIVEMVATALQRQIPMRPLHIHKNYYCPICKEAGWIMWDDAIPMIDDNFCGRCGQAIDWSGIDD